MKMKKADLFVAIYVLTAFIMFIVTLPSWLLDVFLAINIGIAFAIMFGLYVLYDFELFMKEIYQMDMLEFAKNVVFIYGIFLAVVLLITYIVSLYQYNRALQDTKLYYANLKKLSRMYVGEE